MLKAWGLTVENGWPGADFVGPWLFVSTNHDALKRVFDRSDFPRWTKALEHLADLGEPYAPRPFGKPKRFGMHQSRALAVPLTPWLGRPIAVGVDPKAATPFDPPEWDAASRAPSRSASHEESHD